jgi:hypothetical protein
MQVGHRLCGLTGTNSSPRMSSVILSWNMSADEEIPIGRRK